MYSVEELCKVGPPADGDISEFNVCKLAGMLRQLQFDKQTVENCVRKQINGVKLCDMIGSMKDQDLKLELALEKDNHLYTLKHFVSKSETGNALAPPQERLNQKRTSNAMQNNLCRVLSALQSAYFTLIFTLHLATFAGDNINE